MSPHEPPTRPPRLGISLSQLVASALAAASAAFGASYLGVAGTIIGAAVASVIATVAGAMYSSSLQRTRAAVQSTVTLWSRTNAEAPVVDPGAPEPAPATARQPLPWGRLTVAAAAVLVVTLGALTGVEGLLGKPLSSAVGGSDATGTTLGSVDGSHRAHQKKKATTTTEAATPAPTPTPAPQPTPTGDPTSDPTTAPTDPTTGGTSDPTQTPTTPVPTDPTGSPTAGG